MLALQRLIAMLCLLPLVAHADGLGDREASSTTYSSTTFRDSRLMRAADYGLSEAELARYQSIMTGPLGRWYADLDPTWVLGFAARDEAERRRYATLAADMEVRRVQAELAFNRAYSDAIAANGLAMIDEATWRDRRTRRALLPQALADAKQATRRVLYVDGRCRHCSEAVQAILKANRDSLDIYVDHMPDDDAIREWALRHKISVQAVRERRVTLNHFADAEQRLGASLSVDDTVALFTEGPFGLIRAAQPREAAQ